MISRRQIDISIEQKIITGLIISSRFCREIFPALSAECFTSPWCKLIYFDIKTYYDKYLEAPGKQIQDIFEDKKANLSEAEADIVEQFLLRLNSEFSREEFNVEYYIDKALEFIKKQTLLKISNGIKSFIGSNDLVEAEKQIKEYKNVVKNTSQWVDPFAPNVMRRIHETNSDFLFNFQGGLGRYFGGFKRGWLIGILAPVKRGKTWWLQEFAFQALISKLKVCFISLEMGENDLGNRIYKRITSSPSKDGLTIFPIFDCMKNQTGECSRKERENKIILLDAEGFPPEFDPESQYKICTHCKENKLPDYECASWFDCAEKSCFTFSQTSRKIKKFTNMFGRNLRVKFYPRFSANTAQIKRDIELLEYSEEFIPDVIIIDYADILAPEDTRVLGRERIDETWKCISRMANERHCTVVTASQSTRKSFDKVNIEQIDVAEDIRKLAHVDIMLSLNQVYEEKESGVLRVGILAHRNMGFKENSQTKVLYHYDLGQPFLDSEII